MNRTRKVIGTTAAALLLSCTSSVDFAGIQGSGRNMAVRGTITGFGSVFVNGVEYSTAGAAVVLDSAPGTESQLRVGQIVTIKGTVNHDGSTGTATAVSFSGDVRGPVTQINTSGKSFVVLGQTVRINGNTLFDDAIQPADLTGLPTGSTVEVSGFANASGDLIASRVDLRTPGEGLQLQGTVEDLDTAAQTFRINSLLVNFGGSSVATTLAEGSQVEIHGASLTADGVLLATDIENAPGLGAAVNEQVDISGIVTSLTSLLSFTLDGQPIIADLDTKFVLHGIPLGLNVTVNVQGTMTASGAVLAKKIEIRPQSDGLILGLVESVSATTSSLGVAGVNIATDAATEWADRSSQHVRSFKLTDLRVGDYVEIHGAQQPGAFSAATLERRNFIAKKKLQAQP